VNLRLTKNFKKKTPNRSLPLSSRFSISILDKCDYIRIWEKRRAATKQGDWSGSQIAIFLFVLNISLFHSPFTVPCPNVGF
jgi:hypothetical protein